MQFWTIDGMTAKKKSMQGTRFLRVVKKNKCRCTSLYTIFSVVAGAGWTAQERTSRESGPCSDVRSAAPIHR